MELLEQPLNASPPVLLGTSVVEVDERAARRWPQRADRQLERELAQAFATAYLADRPGLVGARNGRAAPARSGGAGAGPRRARRPPLRCVQGDLAERTAREEENRRLIERMMLDPGRRSGSVSREDIGEQGCGHSARPLATRHRRHADGLVAGQASSGCPLARGCCPPSGFT